MNFLDNRLSSQFFIYFMYAIYEGLTDIIYLQYKLSSSLKFSDAPKRYIPQAYPQTKKLFNFYLKLNLYDALDNESQYSKNNILRLIR